MAGVALHAEHEDRAMPVPLRRVPCLSGPSGTTKQLGVWKLCSALARGDLRGTLGYTALEVIAQRSPRIALAQITGSVPLLTGGSLMAIDTIRVALRLYGQRAT
jgi:hypothetical protein